MADVMKRILIIVSLATITCLFAGIATKEAVQIKKNQKLENIKIQSTELQKNELELDLKSLNNRLKQQLERKDLDKKTIEDLKKEIEQQELKERELEAKLQAKREAQEAEKERLAEIARRVTGTQKAYASSGTCNEWIRRAGITDYQNAVELINRESGCNPYAKNSSSGACGVAQELPCGKSGCSFGDGACQVRWMNSYVMGRYGSWANAVSWHNSHNWY
jgi:hypothetical protein